MSMHMWEAFDELNEAEEETKLNLKADYDYIKQNLGNKAAATRQCLNWIISNCNQEQLNVLAKNKIADEIEAETFDNKNIWKDVSFYKNFIDNIIKPIMHYTEEIFKVSNIALGEVKATSIWDFKKAAQDSSKRALLSQDFDSDASKGIIYYITFLDPNNTQEPYEYIGQTIQEANKRYNQHFNDTVASLKYDISNFEESSPKQLTKEAFTAFMKERVRESNKAAKNQKQRTELELIAKDNVYATNQTVKRSYRRSVLKAHTVPRELLFEYYLGHPDFLTILPSAGGSNIEAKNFLIKLCDYRVAKLAYCPEEYFKDTSNFSARENWFAWLNCLELFWINEYDTFEVKSKTPNKHKLNSTPGGNSTNYGSGETASNAKLLNDWVFYFRALLDPMYPMITYNGEKNLNIGTNFNFLNLYVDLLTKDLSDIPECQEALKNRSKAIKAINEKLNLKYDIKKQLTIEEIYEKVYIPLTALEAKDNSSYKEPMLLDSLKSAVFDRKGYNSEESPTLSAYWGQESFIIEAWFYNLLLRIINNKDFQNVFEARANSSMGIAEVAFAEAKKIFTSEDSRLSTFDKTAVDDKIWASFFKPEQDLFVVVNPSSNNISNINLKTNIININKVDSYGISIDTLLEIAPRSDFSELNNNTILSDDILNKLCFSRITNIPGQLLKELIAIASGKTLGIFDALEMCYPSLIETRPNLTSTLDYDQIWNICENKNTGKDSLVENFNRRLQKVLNTKINLILFFENISAGIFPLAKEAAKLEYNPLSVCLHSADTDSELAKAKHGEGAASKFIKETFNSPIGKEAFIPVKELLAHMLKYMHKNKLSTNNSLKAKLLTKYKTIEQAEEALTNATDRLLPELTYPHWFIYMIYCLLCYAEGSQYFINFRSFRARLNLESSSDSTTLVKVNNDQEVNLKLLKRLLGLNWLDSKLKTLFDDEKFKSWWDLYNKSNEDLFTIVLEELFLMTTTYNLPAEIRVLAKATINKNSEKDNFYIKLLFDKDFNKLKSSDIEKLQKDNYSQVIIDKFIKKKSTQKSEYLKINDLFDVYCENILRDPIDTEIIDLMTNSGVDLTREVLQDKDIIAYLKMLVVFDASELSSQKQLIIEKELSLALKKEAMNRKDLIDFIWDNILTEELKNKLTKRLTEIHKTLKSKNIMQEFWDNFF